MLVIYFFKYHNNKLTLINVSMVIQLSPIREWVYLEKIFINTYSAIKV